jgi:hypothetical protein
MDRPIRYSFAGVGFVIAGSILVAASSGSSAEIGRVDWAAGGRLIGDLWTFRCPAGGSVSASVDTIGDYAVPDGDGGGFVSGLDPSLGILDSQGNLIARADDEQACNMPTRCDAGCPSVEVPCARGGVKHSILVRDAGILPECTGGGGYLLIIEVFNRDGESLSARAVKLGGGPRRNLPPWLLDTGLVGRQGPVVDDGPALTAPSEETTEPFAVLEQPPSK